MKWRMLASEFAGGKGAIDLMFSAKGTATLDALEGLCPVDIYSQYDSFRILMDWLDGARKVGLLGHMECETIKGVFERVVGRRIIR